MTPDHPPVAAEEARRIEWKLEQLSSLLREGLKQPKLGKICLEGRDQIRALLDEQTRLRELLAKVESELAPNHDEAQALRRSIGLTTPTLIEDIRDALADSPAAVGEEEA